MPSPVEIRSTDNPVAGWTLDDALALVADGYSPEQASRRSGYAAARLAYLSTRREQQRGRTERNA